MRCRIARATGCRWPARRSRETTSRLRAFPRDAAREARRALQRDGQTRHVLIADGDAPARPERASPPEVRVVNVVPVGPEGTSVLFSRSPIPDGAAAAAPPRDRRWRNSSCATARPRVDRVDAGRHVDERKGAVCARNRRRGFAAVAEILGALRQQTKRAASDGLRAHPRACPTRARSAPVRGARRCREDRCRRSLDRRRRWSSRPGRRSAGSSTAGRRRRRRHRIPAGRDRMSVVHVEQFDGPRRPRRALDDPPSTPPASMGLRSMFVEHGALTSTGTATRYFPDAARQPVHPAIVGQAVAGPAAKCVLPAAAKSSSARGRRRRRPDRRARR